MKEVNRALEQASGVPYKALKKWPRLLWQLWKILKVIWRKRKAAQIVEICRGCLNYKKTQWSNSGPSHSSALKARGSQDYLLKNSCIDNSVSLHGPRVQRSGHSVDQTVAGLLQRPGCLWLHRKNAIKNITKMASRWLWIKTHGPHVTWTQAGARSTLDGSNGRNCLVLTWLHQRWYV